MPCDPRWARWEPSSSTPTGLCSTRASCLVSGGWPGTSAGGLDEEGLPDLFNDVDFCLRLREAGYWNVWTPYAVLIHHESVTRHITSEERNERGKMGQWIKEFERRWGPHLQTDPAHSPNLSLRSEGSGLARPPRIDWPWTRSARR
jgi:hypothetical protein